MKTIGYLKNALMIATGGTMSEALSLFSAPLAKIGNIASIGVNLASVIFAAYFGVMAVFHYIQSQQASNPNEAKQKVDAAKSSLVGACISICANIIINALLTLIGVSFWQVAI